jgi:hypothetical protein
LINITYLEENMSKPNALKSNAKKPPQNAGPALTSNYGIKK